MTEFAKLFRIEVEKQHDGWHGIVVDKSSNKRFVDPRPFPTDNGAVLATRAVAWAKFRSA